jgi:hypothetical protein
MRRIGTLAKLLLVVWMLAQPALYFLLSATPDRGGVFTKLPQFVYRAQDVLLPLFTRKANLSG